MKELLQRLAKENVHLTVKDGNLEVTYYSGEISEELLHEVKRNKFGLIAFLQSMSPTGDRHIPKAGEMHDYPVSSSQHRLWLVSQFEGGVNAYTISSCYRISASLDVTAFRQAFMKVIERHGALRTVFRKNRQGEIRQMILDTNETSAAIRFISLVESPNASPEDIVVSDFLGESFDLEKGPLVSAVLLEKEEGNYLFACKIHHIVADGWSLSLFFHELITNYTFLLVGEQCELPDLRVQYSDYALWESGQLKGPAYIEARKYWQGQFAGDVPSVSFPADYPRPPVKTFNGDFVQTRLSRQKTEQLKKFLYKREVTLFTGLVTLLNALVYKYTREEDVVLGCPVSGRNHADLEEMIGCFVNTVALRTRFSSNDSFEDLLMTSKQVCIDALNFQYYPFDYLVGEVLNKRDVSRSPLFDIMIILQNTDVFSKDSNAWPGGLSIEECTKPAVSGRFDLSFEFREVAGELVLSLEFNTDMFAARTAERISRHFIDLTTLVLDSPEVTLAELDIVSANEREKLLRDFNGPLEAYPVPATIIGLFERQVAKSPQAPAVEFCGTQLSYSELNRQANRLAHFLLKKGVKEGDKIPLCFHRNIELVISVLAVLKTGAAYVPVDPDYPQERIAFILRDTEAGIMLYSEGPPVADTVTCKAISIERNWQDVLQEPDTNLSVTVSPAHLAYIIYTSGSTGKPKGVMVEHKGVANRLNWGQSLFPLKREDIVLQKTTFCFDVSVWELFWPLTAGASMVLAESGEQKDYQYLKKLINERKITVVHFVPSMLDAFLGEMKNGGCSTLSRVFCSGDVFKYATAAAVNNFLPNAAVYNLYGPTEASIEVTWWKVGGPGEYASVPIGKPAPNVRMYILDAGGNLCPIGCIGELYIGGCQVSRGYLNNEHLTEEVFVSDPFSGDGSKMYRTKDLGRWLPDGNIEFWGRTDDQVKIRGYRIELAEIENNILACPGVAQAAVVVVEMPDGDKRLVAFVAPENEFRKEEIQRVLKSKLPEYMLPGFLLPCDSLPRLSNGKIDRKALIAAGLETMSKVQLLHKSPRNSIDACLCDIWTKLLHVEKLSIDADFFMCGGHSIAAIRMASAIRDNLGVELAIKDIFMYPTIEALSDFIAGTGSELKFPVVVPYSGQIDPPLSFNQERLWFLHQLNGSVDYHIPAIWDCRGILDIEMLEYAFRHLVERHQSLRTVIKSIDGTPFQQIQPASQWKMGVVSKDDIANASNQSVEEYIQSFVNSPFDLSADYMLKVTLVVLDEDLYQVVLVIHHIAADAWSLGILFNELSELFNAGRGVYDSLLSPLPVSYADFAFWQRNAYSAGFMDSQAAYWRRQLDGCVLLNLPVDNKSGSFEPATGNVVTSIVDSLLVKEMQQVGRKEGVTVAMIMMTFFYVLLYRCSGQEDIITAGFVANRRRTEIQGLVGFFINTLLFRLRVQGGSRLKPLLHEVKKTVLEAYDNQDLPFEKVVELVFQDQVRQERRLFNVVFDYQDTGTHMDASVHLAGVELSEHLLPHKTSKFDIGFMVVNSREGMMISVEYDSRLYQAVTIVRRKTILAAVGTPTNSWHVRRFLAVH